MLEIARRDLVECMDMCIEDNTLGTQKALEVVAIACSEDLNIVANSIETRCQDVDKIGYKQIKKFKRIKSEYSKAKQEDLNNRVAYLKYYHGWAGKLQQAVSTLSEFSLREDCGLEAKLTEKVSQAHAQIKGISLTQNDIDLIEKQLSIAKTNAHKYQKDNCDANGKLVGIADELKIGIYYHVGPDGVYVLFPIKTAKNSLQDELIQETMKIKSDIMPGDFLYLKYTDARMDSDKLATKVIKYLCTTDLSVFNASLHPIPLDPAEMYVRKNGGSSFDKRLRMAISQYNQLIELGEKDWLSNHFTDTQHIWDDTKNQHRFVIHLNLYSQFNDWKEKLTNHNIISGYVSNNQYTVFLSAMYQKNRCEMPMMREVNFAAGALDVVLRFIENQKFNGYLDEICTEINSNKLTKDTYEQHWLFQDWKVVRQEMIEEKVYPFKEPLDDPYSFQYLKNMCKLYDLFNRERKKENRAGAT